MPEIKEATEKDFETIHCLAHKIWPNTFGGILSSSQIAYMLEMMYSVQSIKEQVEKKGHKFIIAKEEGIPLGYASYQLNYNHLPKTKIHKIYVLPDLQGKGIGRLLMDYISGIAISNKNNVLTLNVNRNNKAVKFYEKIGYKITSEEDIDIGNNYFMNDFVMEKEIQS